MILDICNLAAIIVIMFSITVLFIKTRHLSVGRIKRYIFKKRKIQKWVSIALVIFIITTIVGFNVENKGRGEAVITLEYTDASKAQNSNGTRFDMGEMICDEVIDKAIKKGGFTGVNVKSLKDCLSVKPVVQGDSNNEEGYHISTEYAISYRASKRTRHIDSSNFMHALVYAYKEFYIDNYADDFSVLKTDMLKSEELDSYDYLDIINYLKKQTKTIADYMHELAQKNPSFVSSDGETFSSLAAKAENLNNEQIEKNLKYYVYSNGISKNADKYITRLKYQNKLLDFDAQKARSSYNTRNEAISLYASEMARIVLVPTWDENSEFYMGRTKIGLDELSQQALDYSGQSESLREMININSDIINKLKWTTYQGGNDESLDKMIEDIENVLVQYSEQARKAGQEYSETKINDCISYKIKSASFLYALKTCGMPSVMFLIGLFLLMVAIELLKDENAIFGTSDSNIN